MLMSLASKLFFIYYAHMSNALTIAVHSLLHMIRYPVDNLHVSLVDLGGVMYASSGELKVAIL